MPDKMNMLGLQSRSIQSSQSSQGLDALTKLQVPHSGRREKRLQSDYDNNRMPVLVKTRGNRSARHWTQMPEPKALVEEPRALPLCSEGLTPIQAIDKYNGLLSRQERKEILTFKKIFYFSEKTSSHFSERDHIGYRYELVRNLGEGSFAKVWEAFDHKENITVAVKIVKEQKKTYLSTLQEIEILEGLHRRYQETNRSIEIISHFTFRGTRILVFPLYPSTLRHRMRVGTVSIVRIAYELLLAISQFHKLGVIHSDLKPENIMFSSTQELRVIDFGSACLQKQKLYYYIQSRFYRSPEVILGCPYGKAIDIWSFGCIIAELIIGRPIFPGESETQQLVRIMEYKGFPSQNLMARSKRINEFFTDCVTLKGGNGGRVPGSKKIANDIGRKHELLKLVEMCLEWDPELRLTAENGLKLSLFKSLRN